MRLVVKTGCYYRLYSAAGLRATIFWFLKNTFSRPQESPIFVLGNQKSGTSAVAALLAKATGLGVTIDLGMQVVCPLYDHLEQGDISFDHFVLLNSYSFSNDIVKEPELTFHYNALVKRFPESQVVFVHRDPAENIRSIYERLGFNGSMAVFKRSELDSLPRAWRMIVGAEGLQSDEEVPVLLNLCHRWNKAVETEMTVSTGAFHVTYEKFKADKEGTIQYLAQQLNIPVENSIQDAINISYQPASTSGLKANDFFSSSNYRFIKESTFSKSKTIGYA
jgi:hypothetical protein